MSLRLKIPLCMVVVTGLFSLLTWGVQHLVVIPTFTKLEHDIAGQAISRMTATISRERANLNVRCIEWSNWDDTYQFVQDRNQAFVEVNLTEEWFAKYRLNLMAFCDPNGNVVWGELHESVNGKRLESVTDAAGFLALQPELIRSMAGSTGGLGGVAITLRGPMLIAGESIHKSDGSGASAGVLIIGSFLGDQELASMAGLLPQSVRSWDLRKPLPPQFTAPTAKLDRSGNTTYLDDYSRSCSALVVLRDITGSPSLLVQARFNGDITSRGMAACRFALLAVLLIGLLMLLLVLMVLNRSILGPVFEIIDHVVSIGRTNDLKLRVETKAHGELGTLVTELNQMLDRLAEDNARRRQVEERLRRAEEKYRRIFEDSVVGIFQSTPEGRYISVNAALARIYGYPSARALKEGVEQIGTQVYVDPRRRAEFVAEVEARGTVSGFESQVHRQDGSDCWISETARVVRDEHGRVLFYEGMVEDITERKRAEDELVRFSLAVDQSPASILITDPQGCIRYVNRKFTEISGYTPEEAIGRKPSLLKSGLMPNEVYRELWQTITSGREWHGELQNRRKNGELYWERASISPILNVRGEVTHYLAVKEDITAKRASDARLRRTLAELAEANSRLEEAIERANEMAIQAQAANVAQRSFLAGMSHEIRTPLNGVLGMLDLLMGTLGAPPGEGDVERGSVAAPSQASDLHTRQRRYCQLARRSADMLLSLINDVLDFSKIEAGRLELEAAPFDLVATVNEVAETFAPRAADKGVTLSACVSPEVPDEVVGDAVRIRQILVNLVGNAVKFTPHGWIRVCGSVVEQTDVDALVHFSVADSGIGISEAGCERLFRSFSQADASTTRQYGGTGLGLAICKRLVELMGGRVGVESEPGKGSTFWFTIRLRQVSQTAKEAGEPVGPESAAAKPPEGSIDRPLRILLAEDNEVNQIVAGEMLARLGHSCVAVNNGREAVEAIGRDEFDLVLMDCEMPEMDGLAATRAIREQESRRVQEGAALRRLPIVALTAYAIKGDRAVCLQAGMDDYLTKPIDVQRLERAIRNLREHHGSNQPSAGATSAESPSLAAGPTVENSFSLTAKTEPPCSPEAVPASGRKDPPPIDPQALLGRCMGNSKLADELLDRFAGQVSGVLEKMRKEIEAEKAEGLARLAHTLRGTAASMSAEPVRQAAGRLEHWARLGRLDEASRELGELGEQIHHCLAYIPRAQVLIGDITSSAAAADATPGDSAAAGADGEPRIAEEMAHECIDRR